jgi:hypothetical protein
MMLPNLWILPMHRLKLFLPAFIASVSLTAIVAANPASVSAAVELRDGHLSLKLDRISAEWSATGGVLKPLSLTDAVDHRVYNLASTSLFTIRVQSADKNGMRTIDSSKLQVIVPMVVTSIDARPESSNVSARVPGWQATATLSDPQSDAQFSWRLIARAGQSYARQELTIASGKHNLDVRRVTLIDWPLRFPWVDGSTPGSPIVSGNLFCGVEHPSSLSEIDGGKARCSLERTVAIPPDQTCTISAVVGAAQPGQLRRDFQTYLNNERPRPYSTFLHYNSWYDLGYFTPFGESDALNAINTIGRELSQKRGVKISSFMFDDGWDNHQSVWSFNSGFPNGFTPLIDAARHFDAGLGVWMSPWGGYSKPQEERLTFGRSAGYETNEGGYALSGPKYFEAFRSVCLEMLRKYGVNQFKFDGTGNVTTQYPGSKFGTDFDAMIALIQDLRTAKPDLFVNLTTGTWPSPFWTRFADSIWRGGDDHSFAGVGTYRQRWITYRDGDEYRGIVQLGPLFPMNSLMLHGIIYAKHANHLGDDPADDFADEVHDYFGTGNQLQEMYITGALLSQSNWDTLAEAAKWSRANMETLRDVHWVGGDPTKGECYGYAAWSQQKGILTLRNPSDEPMSIELDPAKAFELPDDAVGSFTAHSPWTSEKDQLPIALQRGVVHRFELRPWQLLTVEAIPAK